MLERNLQLLDQPERGVYFSCTAGLLDSRCAQTQPRDGTIVASSSSTDQTGEIISSYAGRLPLRVLSAPGWNIAQGRNLATLVAAIVGPPIPLLPLVLLP